ncbi:MAG: Lpg0189 family type II secretion system effector [Legionella sp.]|nr:Lpg0189 family type II secretion system effector [Legionella sp.]
MKFSYLIAPLILLPLYAFSYPKDDSKTMFLSAKSENQNTLSKTYSNEQEHNKEIKTLTRNTDFPTQVIRMDGLIENQQITCEEVHAQINRIFVDNIATTQFIHAMYISCNYDPKTYYATQFTINSYFDPVNEEAIAYLKTYLNEYNGSDLLGNKFKIESAKGLIISLHIAAGIKKNPSKPPFIEYRKDRSNFYFKSNYEMKNKLVTDIYENFYSNNSEQILPFLDRWIFANASILYKAVLRDSNYTELEPERIFLMENGEEIFVSGVKQYFIHHCEKYQNHRCLSTS